MGGHAQPGSWSRQSKRDCASLLLRRSQATRRRRARRLRVQSKKMVLLGRIELPASPLPRVRSTTELQQHPVRASRRALLLRACSLSSKA